MEIISTQYIRTETVVKVFGVHWELTSDPIEFKSQGAFTRAEKRELNPPSGRIIAEHIIYSIKEIRRGYDEEANNLLFYVDSGQHGLIAFKFAVERTPELDNLYEQYINDNKKAPILNYMLENEEYLRFS